MKGQQHLCATHLPAPKTYTCQDLYCLTDGGMAMCLDCQRDAGLLHDEVAAPAAAVRDA